MVTSTRNVGTLDCGKSSRAQYVLGCRCFACRLASADYERERERRKKEGNRSDSAMVGSTATETCRRHVNELLANGWTKRGISRASGVSRNSLNVLLTGRHHHARVSKGTGTPFKSKRMMRSNYKALMALDGDRRLASGELVDNGRQVQRIIRYAFSCGLSAREISEATGIPKDTVYSLKYRDRACCKAKTLAAMASSAERLKALCDERGRVG